MRRSRTWALPYHAVAWLPGPRQLRTPATVADRIVAGCWCSARPKLAGMRRRLLGGWHMTVHPPYRWSGKDNSHDIDW